LVRPQAFKWIQGEAWAPIDCAEQCLNQKLLEIGEDFTHLVFSGVSSQELKKLFTEKDDHTLCSASVRSYVARLDMYLTSFHRCCRVLIVKLAVLAILIACNIRWV
jgi:hypothetical protein